MNNSLKYKEILIIVLSSLLFISPENSFSQSTPSMEGTFDGSIRYRFEKDFRRNGKSIHTVFKGSRNQPQVGNQVDYDKQHKNQQYGVAKRSVFSSHSHVS